MSGELDSAVPSRNLKAYILLFVIENSLRQLIISRLQKVAGDRWHKSRLPDDVLRRYKQGIEYERGTTWATLVPHHPIYYVEFPDLRKTIERDDNWRDAFVEVFTRKDVISATLSEIEVVRNRVAHNRLLGDGDLRLLENTHTMLVSWIGQDTMREFAVTTTCVLSIRENLTRLLHVLREAGAKCCQCCSLDTSEEIHSFGRAWWLDSDYLGSDVTDVLTVLATLEEYSRLPRGRGFGPRIESWICTKHLAAQIARAEEQLQAVLASAGGRV